MNMRDVRSRITGFLKIEPAGWSGAATALRLAAWVVLIAVLLLGVLPHVTAGRLLGNGVLIVMALAGAILSLLLVRLLRTRDLRFWWGVLLFICAMLVLLGSANMPIKGQVLILTAVVAGIGLLGGCIALWRVQGLTSMRAFGVLVGAAITFGVVALAAIPGWQVKTEQRPPVAVPASELPDPSRRGEFVVQSFTYGSGTDPHRAEFAADASLRSRTVDGSRLIDGWDGAAGWARNRYWGFDSAALPLNGRVWMPRAGSAAEQSAHPVVLIVHGNHDMEDFSDTGYAWIGEHLASRGVVTVSVDENFLNSSYSDLLSGLDGGLEKENDARGWLLLEHLRQLREWNAAPGNPFSGRLDLDRVVLIGHSRGGEAVAEAALFNRMRFYPDDARQTFDFGFGIVGLIAIAPADGQYDPRDRKTWLDDVNYLVIHGSLDGDVQSFQGTSQYARIAYPQCVTCFKTSIYVVGANHGQFNTGWGRADYGAAGRLTLNLEPIMDAELQRAAALPLFTAFVDAVTRGDVASREVFATGLRAAPFVDVPVELITDYRSGEELALADFEEDADPSTATLPAARIETASLSRWRESEIGLKWAPRDSAAVLIGWDRQGESIPVWQLVFESSPPAFGSFSFSLAMAEENPLAERVGDQGVGSDTEEEAEEQEWKTPAALDFSIVVEDRSGQHATIHLADLGVLRPPVEGHTRKHAWLDGVEPSEPVFARYTIPAKSLAPLDLDEVSKITLQFDQDRAGAIWLDDVVIRPAPIEPAPFEVESGG